MPVQTVSILDGNEFVVSDIRGDLEATPTDNHGLFRDDTRFLSRWILTINGQRPMLLSINDLAYFRIRFFLALATGTVYVDSHLSVQRQRSVGRRGFHEDIILFNHAHERADLEVRLEAAADFADLFEVKDKVEKKGECYRGVDSGRLVLRYERGTYRRETVITSSEPAEMRDGALFFQVRIPPHAQWSTCLDVAAISRPHHGDAAEARSRRTHSAHASGHELETNLQDWVAGAPKLNSTWAPLEHIYRRSLVDLAALRFRNPAVPGALPAAGLPWFMAIFGRDSLITSFQALPFVPELAATTLRTLALIQGRVIDPFREEEPGKIAHELRLGEMTAFEERPHSPYYGSADSTALFLVLLDEYERWTGDRALVAGLEREARAAIEWVDHYGDRDGDGFIEYERQNTQTGLENQCWKDSGDSIVFADGTLAPTPRGTCELQGYVYDAKLRTARLAREVWDDADWADRLERQARDLKQRFNEAFWIPERGFFALALDGRKRKVDALTSNIGHLLWSGIANKDAAESCARHLMSDALFSGWGVRTMAAGEGSFNPIGYHVGTVWPHDTSIIAWGLRRYGYRKEAARLAWGILEAAELFHHRLPEAFAGYAREATMYPVEYPTACSPQAWATGAPLLLVRTLLGLEPHGEHLVIDPCLPEPIGRLELLDIPGRWGRMDAFGRARLVQ
ncbi:MAG: amylo-alpha,6-glucosidase [Gammaproteobacteria bacterium]|jgi:glycogen debranching enzyme|nr:amylo-alpha,6-glucosidase [Gammaproteobacteria bacterium]